MERLFGITYATSQQSFSDALSAAVEDCIHNLANKSLKRFPVQKSLTKICDSFAYDGLLREFYPHSFTRKSAVAARFLSGSCREAVAWAVAVPTVPDLTLTAEEYHFLLSFCLMLPVPGRALLGDACPGRHDLDASGHHLFTCFHNRVPSHDFLRDKLHAFCRSAGLPAKIEPQNMLTLSAPDSLRRPDLAVSNLVAGGRVLILDVTSTDPVLHLTWLFTPTEHIMHPT
jgi:hypothetical protein